MIALTRMPGDSRYSGGGGSGRRCDGGGGGRGGGYDVSMRWRLGLSM